MSADSQRCSLRGCTAWAFQGPFCRTHARADADPALKEQLKLTEMYRNSPALQKNLVVIQQSPHPSHLPLSEGEYVDVVSVCSDGVTYIVRGSAGVVGYFDARCLLTEEEVYQTFLKDEAARAAQAEAERLAQARLAEQQFEEHLRISMKQRAEEDRQRLAQEAERRRLFLEEQMRIARDEAERQEKERARAAEAARIAREENARRMEEERRLKAIDAHVLREHEEMMSREERSRKESERTAWEIEMAKKKEEAYLATLPKWKRELVLRKKREAASLPPTPPSGPAVLQKFANPVLK